MTDSLQKIDPESAKILQDNLVELYMQSSDCEACKGSGWRSKGGDSIGTWPCEFCSRPAKRPYNMPQAQRRSVYVDGDTWAALKEIGQGNASEGMRRAVSQYDHKILPATR